MSRLAADHPHAWREASKGLWSRPLTSMEPYFVFFGNLTTSMFGGREHYVVYSAVQFQTLLPLDIKNLKEAWRRLRFEQPNLATTTNIVDWTLNYQVPTAEDIDQWLSETFVVFSQTKAVDLYPNLQPIKNATLYLLPDSNELVFRCPHSKIDGLGTWLFWDAFFACLGNCHKPVTIPWGEEVAKLPPSIEHILGHSTSPTAEQINQVQAIVDEYLSKSPGISPVSAQGSATGKCQKLELELEESMTSAVIAASKVHGLSVTSVVHAAFALANAKHAAPELKGRDYLTSGQFNLRGYLSDSEVYARSLCPYYAIQPAAFPVLDFEKMSRRLHDYYHQTYPAAIRTTGHLLRSLVQVVQTPEFLAAPIPGDALLSSLGIAEHYLKRIYPDISLEITNIDNAIDVVLGVPLVSLYTFRDRLHMTYCYNDGAQSREQIQRILDATLDILKQELSLT